jgi:hypothetical protein
MDYVVQFSGTMAYDFVKKVFVKNEYRSGNPSARDLFTYGTTDAKKQWAAAIAGPAPPSHGAICYMCKLPINDRGNWNSGQVEHLLPSALAFLLFGLPTDFSRSNSNFISKIRSIPGLAEQITSYQQRVQTLQSLNFDWAHAYCNGLKSDFVFLNILKASPSCFGDDGRCSITTVPDFIPGVGSNIGIGNGRTLDAIQHVIGLMVNGSETSQSVGRPIFLQNLTNGGLADNDSKANFIGSNIVTKFTSLTDQLNTNINNNNGSLLPLMLFNLKSAITIALSKKDGTPSSKYDEAITNFISNSHSAFTGGSKRVRQRGGNEEFIPEDQKISEEDFTTLIEYMSGRSLPSPISTPTRQSFFNTGPMTPQASLGGPIKQLPFTAPTYSLDEGMVYGGKRRSRRRNIKKRKMRKTIRRK